VIRPGYFLANDREHIKSLISADFPGLAGSIATRTILDAPAVLYSGEDLDLPDPMEQSAENYVTSYLNLGHWFLMALWFVKDNAVMCNEGYLEYPYKSQAHRVYGCSHSLGRYYWDSPAERIKAEFSADELRIARTLAGQLAVQLGLSQNAGIAAPTLPAVASRLDRVWWVLEAARMTADVAVKIAHYVTCFESLFSTDQSELSHKLAERVAWFLGEDPEQRLSLYRNIKDAYAVRSRAVHGDKLSDKQFAELRGVSATCDRILRFCLLKIARTEASRDLFNGKKSELEDFLLDLTVRGVSAAG
jgi:hypothetical protein